MGHKAGREFFAAKRDWSKRKDQILGYYLRPYLAHVAKIPRPIVIVDGFAGPGRFGDGEPGSPVVICEAVKVALPAAPAGKVTVVCVEPDPELHARLQQEISPFAFASTQQTRFGDFFPNLQTTYAAHTVLLYLDPFALEGIEWAAVDGLFSQIAAGRSVEVLWNFNVVAFARVGRSVLKTSRPSEEAGIDELADAWIADGSATGEVLDAFAGPVWWRAILGRDVSFDVAVAELATGFCDRLRARFAEIAMHVIRDDPRHRLPKYVLAFGSRAKEAVPLINDAMHQALRSFLARPGGIQGALFAARPFDDLPTPDALPDLVEGCVNQPTSRGELMRLVMRAHVGMYSEAEIRRAVDALRKSGRLVSATNRTRINDAVVLWRKGSGPGPTAS